MADTTVIPVAIIGRYGGLEWESELALQGAVILIIQKLSMEGDKIKDHK